MTVAQNRTLHNSSLAHEVRADFPILAQQVQGCPLIYFDNAATAQKPRPVLEAMQDYYQQDNSNVHRGAHTLSMRATDAYEGAREKIARFVNAASPTEIIYTRNASEAINLVAYSWGMENLQPGDEIIVTVMEHHSNLIPWQLISQRTGAVLKAVQLTPTQEFDLEHFKSLLGDRTQLVAVNHISNTLGCVNPIAEIIPLAHHWGAKVLVDACQSVPHLAIDVQQMDCDWLVASGHKMCGPTGIGFLYGKRDLLLAMPPFLGGGEMIAEVFLDHATYAQLPHKFEAGTPAIAQAIGLGAAVDYLTQVGMDRIDAYEKELTAYLFKYLKQIPALTLYGPQPKPDGSNHAALATFTVQQIHADDLATLLDQAGVAIRSGHHCTQLLHRYLQVSSTDRASLYFYNTFEEIDAFVVALKETIEFFAAVA